MTRLKFGTLCDFAQLGQAGKLTIVGLFDCLWIPEKLRAEDGAMVLPIFYIAGVIAAPNAMAGKHKVTFQLLDDDAGDLGKIEYDAAEFIPADPHHELQWFFIHNFVGMRLPGYGDYTMEVRVDGVRIGEILFHVEAPSATIPTPIIQ